MAARPVLLVALSVTLSAAAALAADPPAPPEKQRPICRGGQRQLGTHMRTPRRCLTAEQWQREDETNGPLPLSLQVTEGQNDGRQSAAPR
jgi:Spy/CpxP family protein refolding chaperone